MPFRKDLPGGLRWSVRTRILAAMLAVTAIGLVAAGSTAYIVQRERILQSIDEKLLHAHESVRAVAEGPEQTPEQSPTSETPDDPDASTDETPPTDATTGEATEGTEKSTPPLFDSSEALLQAVLARVLPDEKESSLGLLDGKPRYVSVAEVAFHLEDDPQFITRVIAEAESGSARIGTYVGDIGTLRFIVVPINAGADSGSGIFVTAIDIDAELGEVTTAFKTYTWVAGVALLTVGLVGWFVAGRLLRPIRALTETASRINASDLHERIPVRGNDDISALTVTVNEMLERIDQSLRTQGQLLDDIRHELKTPVTIVRGHLELVDAADPEDVRLTRDLVIDELDRMATLIDDIEALSESEQMQLTLEETDTTQLCQQIFTKCSAIPGHEWSLDLSSSPRGSELARLDPQRITQAMLQLADNAAKYSPDDTTVTIGLTHLPDAVHFWVADEGPGIAEESQQRIFERFGRVDTGRGIDGSGLGLAIVDAIARSHGGRVSLTSSPAGSTFTIKLPLPPQEAQ